MEVNHFLFVEMFLIRAFVNLFRFLSMASFVTGGTPLYGLYRYVRPQTVWFFSRFGHNLGIDRSHFAAILVINRVSIFAL